MQKKRGKNAKNEIDREGAEGDDGNKLSLTRRRVI